MTEELGGLSVNHHPVTGTVTFTSTIGDTSNGAGVIGITTVGNSTTLEITFSSTDYSFDGATTFTAKSDR